ncbi:MAG TPA: type II toxin-antitoxin system VapC family toxin [Kofleriaceae bacterium]|jgi:predicted nucleic acid-binding protein|nr:type II toxin-antitoxin system VapC family toxin [Kofleriaceae bacterium]
MSILVDTNVLSELARPRPDPRVVDWAGGLSMVILSVVTIEEVFFGLSAKSSPRIERWFEDFLESDCRILEITTPIARHAGVLRGQLAKRGRLRAQADMLIAATAALHGLTLATRNERDFKGCGVTVVNPFMTALAE